jgi:flavin reductase (DIM6/NTAB) family NADH-FMN oxidoreductase RutF
MSAPSDAVAELARQANTAMIVVTTIAGDERSGCLVGFQAQCSIDPVRWVVLLSKANHTYRVGLWADVFAVHFLDAGQREVAELFGTTSGDDADKFDRCEWAAGPGGVPLLRACPNRFVGRRTAMFDEGGDHVFVVLDPIEGAAPAPFTPLRLSDVLDFHPGHEAGERPV